MLLFSISLNLFIVVVVFVLAFWGVFVLLYVGNRTQKKTKRPNPSPYTFFQPTAPDTGWMGESTHKGIVPMSTVNTDELRFGIEDVLTKKPPTPAADPIPSPTAIPELVQDGISDDNPDFAPALDEELDDSLASPHQVMLMQPTAVPVDVSSTSQPFDFNQPTMLDEEVLNQVESIFGNESQMELLDAYHTEANRVMLITGEDYHTVFYRLIEQEPEANRKYLTSMLLPPDAPEYNTTMSTVLAMSDEEEVDF